MKKTDPNEYVSLKAEMSARIQLINVQENTAILMTAAFWGGRALPCLPHRVVTAFLNLFQ